MKAINTLASAPVYVLKRVYPPSNLNMIGIENMSKFLKPSFKVFLELFEFILCEEK